MRKNTKSSSAYEMVNQCKGDMHHDFIHQDLLDQLSMQSIIVLFNV